MPFLKDLCLLLSRLCLLVSTLHAQVTRDPVRGSGKLEGLEKLARASGHSLTSLFKCVKCSLQLDLTLNRVFLENILTMPCLGSVKSPLSSMIEIPILMRFWSSTAPRRIAHTPWRAHQLWAFSFVLPVAVMLGLDPKG